jgi:hypothetical protein
MEHQWVEATATFLAHSEEACVHVSDIAVSIRDGISCPVFIKFWVSSGASQDIGFKRWTSMASSFGGVVVLPSEWVES